MASDAAAAKLDALKAQCFAACDEPAAAWSQLSADEQRAAMVAHHVGKHGANSLSEAIKAGPLKFLDQGFIAEVARVASEGGDALKAAGARKGHVDLLAAAEKAHEPHREALAQAYAEFAASGD